MFDYRLKQNPIREKKDGFIEDYLRKLGIRDISSFTDMPRPEDELHYSLLDNISKATEMLYKHLMDNNSIHLVVDSDVDGYTSAAIIYSFIKDLHPDADIDYYIHPEKEHGVVPDEVPFGTSLVIIPDAGSNQYEELEELVGRGVDVLILDHHLVDPGETFLHENVVIVNNQISKNFPNKSLSGAGIAYKFLQAYADRYEVSPDFVEVYVDLAMLGILSDMMLITQLDNNYIIRKGLKNINNKMIKALLNKQSFSVSSTTTPHIIDMVFYITPVINGTIRMGTLQEKANIFEALVNNYSTELFSREWRGETIVENLYDKVARECYNIKEKQNRVTEKTMERICDYIEENKLYENQVIIYKTSKSDTEDVQKSLTGLVAMKILQKYSRPTLILRPVREGNKFVYRGSGRGKKTEGFQSFRDFLNGSGLVDYAQGHDMAFGVGIPEEKIDELVAYGNSTLSNVDFGTDIIEVDYIFDNENLDAQMLKEFASNMHLYGNGIPQPLFAFELMLSPSNFTLMGKKKDTVKITYNGTSFIKFRSAEWAETLSYNMQFPLVKAVIIGRAQLNEFNGNVSVQVVMDYLDLQEVNPGDLL